MFLTASYLSGLTGLAESLFTTDIINLAEAKAKSLLGFLEEEERVKTLLLFEASKYLDLEEPATEVSKIEYRYSSGDFTEVEDYRFLPQKKLVILDAELDEDAEIQVTMSLGWDADACPDLVMQLLSLVALDVLNTFKPGTFSTSTIESKKIGDYTIKYKVSESEMASNLSTTISELVSLVKNGGGSEPTVLR